MREGRTPVRPLSLNEIGGRFLSPILPLYDKLMKTKIALAMGANLGDDPAENIRWGALKLLEAGVEELLMAPIIRTKPVDCVPGTPDFLNTAVVGQWGRSPLTACPERLIFSIRR